MLALSSVVIVGSLDEGEVEDDAWDSVEVERDFCPAGKGTGKLSNFSVFSVVDWSGAIFGWTTRSKNINQRKKEKKNWSLPRFRDVIVESGFDWKCVFSCWKNSCCDVWSCSISFFKSLISLRSVSDWSRRFSIYVGVDAEHWEQIVLAAVTDDTAEYCRFFFPYPVKSLVDVNWSRFDANLGFLT